MAGKRLTKSTIDWIKFAERVPENQKAMFQAFKAKSDGYIRKAFSLPESSPTIDWAYYRARALPASLVDQFEKQYLSLQIPYPNENVSSEIDAQEKVAEQEALLFIKESNNRIANFKKELEHWDNVIPFDHMTMDDFKDAFPEYAYDPLNRPTAFPHEIGHMNPGAEQEAALKEPEPHK